MATLEDFRAWYDRDLGRFAPWKTSVQVLGVGRSPTDQKQTQLRIFTDKNRYSVTVRESMLRPRRLEPHEWAEGHAPAPESSEWVVNEMDGGYLGCISSSRRWRAGEDWHRGSDLKDGPLTESTWHSIVADMLACELVEIAKDVREGRNRGIADGVPTVAPGGLPQVVDDGVVALQDVHAGGGRPLL